MRVAMQILEEEVTNSVDKNNTTPKLLKILKFLDKVLGISISQSGALPSALLIEEGIIKQILKLLFSKRYQRNHDKITPKALLVLCRLTYTHG